MKIDLKKTADILKVSARELDTLSKEDSNGKPLYKDRGVVGSSLTAILEAVSSIALNLPGVGSAVGIAISGLWSLFRR